jgi:integrator complex subunit 1
MDSTSDAGSDQLKMIRAVHNVLPKKLSADGMAAALLSLLFRRSDHPNMMTSSHSVKQVRALMRAIAKELGASFDAFQLLSSIISRKIPLESWTAEDVENKARLIFQCATHVARKRGSFRKAQPNASNGATDEEKSQALKQRLVEARRLILRWCCRHYAPTYKESPATKPNGNKEKKESTDEIVGAGPADFSSILDGQDGTEFPAWLNVMRSILFLEDSDSPRLKHFLAPDGSAVENDSEWDDEANRINQCCSQGADLDDEMVWTILKSATMKKGGMPQKMALPLLEHLFESCKKENKARLHIRDPNILWELYKLVEYVPYRGRELKKENEDGDVEMKDAESGAPKSEAGKVNEDKDSEESDSQFPQLAYPGMWWRVTGLALIICGMAPNEVGSVAWKEHPTLRALMKMVTSDRYRFPTADCDPTARDEMLKTEQAMRGEEAKVTELLFNSKKSPKKKKKKVAIEPPRGSRMSKRQKEKREQQLKKQREKEAAQAAAETNRRKKMLRAAQKSIMLWDPKKGARKPPKESVDMILSVSEFFDLPRSFQQNTEPDFLLMTIGNTTRGAIERAYDWLIPIISFIPNAISRLPASASCFLLLRAYGTEGEERAQLQELSTPLLLHVRDSLTGNFGEADAIRAFDLLLADASSQNADRRRCARRVLNDALGKEETISFDNNASFQKTNFVWMIKVLHVQHATSVMSDAIKYIYRAASFERGKTLRFHVLALEQLTEFAKEKGIPGNWDFPSMLINLISKRPTILAETMSSFPDLRSTAIRIVHDEFSAYVAKSPRNGELKEEAMVEINLYCGAVMPDDSNCRAVEATLPLSLLESSCVLLSIWLDDDKEGSEKGSENQKARDLVRMLMRPHETGASEASVVDDSVGGLASTRIAGSGKSAVPVESVSMPSPCRKKGISLTSSNDFAFHTVGDAR